MTELPSGWGRAEISDLCNLINGRAFKPQEWSEFGLPIIRIQNLNNADAKFNHFSGTFDAKHHVKNGDLLFAWSGTPGTSFGAHIWYGGDAVLNQHIFKIEFSELEINRGFLRYAINQKLDELIGSAQGGVGLRHVTKGTFEKTEIVFPPRAEQTRIAAKLDELLAQVDTLKCRIDGIPALLKRFRQSVLAAAVSGRLTEEWRKQTRDTQEVVLQHRKPPLHQIYAEDNFTAPPNWLLTALGNVANFQQGLQIAKSERRNAPSEDSLPILRTVNYENEFKDDVHYAAISEKSIIAEEKDIILSRTGTVGRVLTGYRGIMHNNSFRINYESKLLQRDYLIYFLESPLCQEYIKKKSGKSSQPDLTHKEFSKCPALVPPICEQKEIVRRVEQLFAFADQLEAKVASAKKRIDHLTQSILAKAFRGELVPQDPNDEPASVLLQRIKTQRATTPKAKRGRTKAGA